MRMSAWFPEEVRRRWILPAEVFASTGTKKMQFTVSTPRETAINYINRLTATLPVGSSFMTLTMHDADPQGTARTMNAWLHEYVDVAAQLKKQNVVEYSNILAGQLGTAERSLHDAENALDFARTHAGEQSAGHGHQSPRSRWSGRKRVDFVGLVYAHLGHGKPRSASQAMDGFNQLS